MIDQLLTSHSVRRVGCYVLIVEGISNSYIREMKYLHCFLSTILHNSLMILVHSNRFTCTEKYVDVPVDHFSFSDDRTFALRYCINDYVWEPNAGPIFLHIGGEAAIEHSIKNSGFVWESAIGFRALVVFAEHRFYGKSKPFGDLSYTDPKYYSYLSTQQALADFVDVVFHLREEKKNFSRNQTHDLPNPVIAFGGSYGGVLAAWMRLKYPAIIEGSLASSAPIWGFSRMVSCHAFAKQLTSIYASTYKLCSKNIQNFWNELDRVAETDEGRSWLTEVWQLCDPLATNDDVRKFRSLIEDIFKAAAMVNYPYSADFFTPLPANPVKEMCVFINKPNLSGNLLVETMRKAVSVYTNYTGEQSCFHWNVSAFGNNFQMEAWNIQTCLDVVMPYCTNGLTDMFLPSNWTFQEWDERCYSSYKLHPREDLVEKFYGGLNIDATSNIIFSNGELDPFMSSGVKHFKLSSSIKTVVLAKAAHQLDLRATNANDPPNVKRVRESYKRTFVNWITAFYKKQATLYSELEIRLNESSTTSGRSMFSWLSD